MQRHFGGDTRQRLHQKVGCAHPGLDGAEGMLNRLAQLAHLFRMFVEPALHRLKNVLVLPSGDPSFLAGGAAVLDGAALAGVGPVAAQEQTAARQSRWDVFPSRLTRYKQTFFLGRIVVREPFTGRTNVDILRCHVAEVLLAEPAFRL